MGKTAETVIRTIDHEANASADGSHGCMYVAGRDVTIEHAADWHGNALVTAPGTDRPLVLHVFSMPGYLARLLVRGAYDSNDHDVEVR